jgi:hypothetical protein
MIGIRSESMRKGRKDIVQIIDFFDFSKMDKMRIMLYYFGEV